MDVTSLKHHPSSTTLIMKNICTCTEVATSSYPAYALARQSAGVIRYFQFLLKTSIHEPYQKLRSNIK